MLDWLNQNKEWIFQGFGGLILVGALGWLFKKFISQKPPDPHGKSARFSNIKTREGSVDIEDETGDAMDVHKVDAGQDFKVKRSHGGDPSPK